MESAKHDMLVYKLIVFELKTVVENRKGQKGEEGVGNRDMSKQRYY